MKSRAANDPLRGSDIRHEKRMIWEDGSLNRVAWIGKLWHPRGFAVEFHIRVYEDPKLQRLAEGSYRGKPCSPMGIEIHRRQPASYDDPGKDADHYDCTVLGGKCWHDGTSLRASEFFYTWGGSDEEAFAEVNRWIRREIDKLEPEGVS